MYFAETRWQTPMIALLNSDQNDSTPTTCTFPLTNGSAWLTVSRVYPTAAVTRPQRRRPPGTRQRAERCGIYTDLAESSAGMQDPQRSSPTEP